MEIPDKVRIGSVDYEVTFEDKTIVLDAVQCKGKIDYEYHKINIDSSVQDKQGQEQTFLHELIHGIFRERNLNLESADEETIVDGLAIGLHQVIRDNPEIFINYIKVGDIECGSITTNEKEDYTNYMYDGKCFIVINGHKWVGIYNMDSVISIICK